MIRAINGIETGVEIGGIIISKFHFADDVSTLSVTNAILQRLVENIGKMQKK